MRKTLTPQRTLIVVLLVVALSPHLAACAGVQPSYPIQDTGLHAERSSELVWLDNHRLRFRGYRAAEPQGPEFHGVPRLAGSGFYIWDTDANRVVTDPSLEGAMRICVQGDVLTFVKKSPTDENKRLVVTREKGQETVRPLVNPEWFNRFSCRYYEQKPQWDRGHASLPLLEEHGSLFFKDSRENNPIMFFSPTSEKGVPLPIGTRQVWHNLVQYAPFKNAYLLYPIAYIDPETGKEDPIGPWPKGKPVPMWWLTPDGKVTTEHIPYMPFMRGGSRGFYPTRAGIFITSHKTDDLGKPGDAGGYLAQASSVEKLITGLLENVSVSPDRCQVAFLYDPYDTLYGKDRLNRINVKIINFCQEVYHAR
jgi:hypothetical protein